MRVLTRIRVMCVSVCAVCMRCVYALCVCVVLCMRCVYVLCVCAAVSGFWPPLKSAVAQEHKND